MACPTCSHTMNDVMGGGFEDEHNRYYCLRCGTLVVEGSDENATHVPTLVTRCLHFEPTLPDNTYMVMWKQMGIYESIHKPVHDRAPEPPK